MENSEKEKSGIVKAGEDLFDFEFPDEALEREIAKEPGELIVKANVESGGIFIDSAFKGLSVCQGSEQVNPLISMG